MTVKPASRTVCVLGGTGFVGRVLVNDLVRAGYRVRVPTRNPHRNRDLLVLPGLELPAADVHDERTLARLLARCEAAVNLVSILNERGHDGSGFRRVHVDLAAKVVRACHEAEVGRLLHMSALKANAERGPSHYLRTKGQAEQAVKSQSGESIRYTIFRPSTIFGANGGFVQQFARLLKAAPVLPLPAADARMAPVFVDDVARAFLVALENGHTQNRTYELCGPDIYSLEELVRLIRQELGLRRAILRVPKFLGRLQAWASDYLVPGKPFSLDNFRSLSVSSVCTENGLAALGIEPRSFETLLTTFFDTARGRPRPDGSASRPS
ncbi:MAG TPA: complex I NDUFA9 subunit family protein [Gammaproteobacteria bacterium]|nr:complex I NDUFA9 subunit family protein [Gammaproteobacteria bacterium]